MSLTQFPNGISSMGIPIVGGSYLTTGDIHFVDSATGSNATDRGGDTDHAFADVDYAIGQCTASKGDFIFAMPGHAETGTAAADWALDVAGVSIVGIGNMDLRPTLTLGTSTACDVNVTGANCLIRNIKFVSAINSLINFLDLDVGTFTAEHCHFVTSSTYEVVTFVDIATTMDNFRFSDCEFYQPTDPEGTSAAAGTGGIFCVDTENILVERCRFVGYFETAIFHNRTTKVQRLNVNHCELTNLHVVPFVLVAASTGCAFQCYGESVAGSDVTDAQLFGTIGTRFWLNDCHMGNDSGGGGQMGAPGTICT